MKVCFISFFAYPLFNEKGGVVFGGAEVQLYNLAKYLVHDHKVIFIVGNFGQEKEEEVENIKILRSVKIGSEYGILEKVKSIFIQLSVMKKSNADIFVKRAAGPEVGIIAAYCRIFRKKFIYMTAHEIDCSGEYKRSNWLLGLLYEFGLKRADMVITQNNDHKKMLKDKYNIEAGVLFSGYDIPQMRTKLGDYILWVARLDEWKQPEVFFKLARSLPNESFVMIAPFSRDIKYAKKIQDDAGKIKNIKFIPGVSFSEVDRYFQSAKIFVNTSRYEGFPNTFAQAIMHGVPLVSFAVNPDNFIEKNSVGFCAENDFTAMKNYVNILLKDKKMHASASMNAYRYAKKNHSMQEIYPKFLRILRKVYEK